jgi:hypothetical protein
MPVLSELLSSIKTQGSVYFCDKLDPPWEMAEKVNYSSAFHYVRRGQCWISFSGEDYLLGPGDLVFIGRGAIIFYLVQNRMKQLIELKVLIGRHIFCADILVFVTPFLRH